MKKIIQKLFGVFGLKVMKTENLYLEYNKLLQMLNYHQIDLIIDIGANKGQYATKLFNVDFKGKIISFEPLSSAHSILSERTKQNPSWTAAERCAIGEKDGITSINISKNSYSSSLLPMLETHSNAAPESIYVDSEKVKIFRLDTIISKYIKGDERIFIKIDTQGYENKILEGATNIIDKIKGIQLETSLVPLYQNETLFTEMLENLNKLGFRLYNLFPGFKDKKTGRLLQVDCVFFK